MGPSKEGGEKWAKFGRVHQKTWVPFFIVYPYGKQCCLSALELFHCLPPLFCCLPLWKTVRLHGKKLQNATNDISGVFDSTTYLIWIQVIFLCENLICISDHTVLGTFLENSNHKIEIECKYYYCFFFVFFYLSSMT